VSEKLALIICNETHWFLWVFDDFKQGVSPRFPKTFQYLSISFCSPLIKYWLQGPIIQRHWFHKNLIRNFHIGIFRQPVKQISRIKITSTDFFKLDRVKDLSFNFCQNLIMIDFVNSVILHGRNNGKIFHSDRKDQSIDLISIHKSFWATINWQH